MKYIVFVLMLVLASTAVFASEDDSLVAVYALGRTGTRMASAFAVGNGSFIVVSSNAVTENVYGQTAKVPLVVVVSKYTGDTVPATIETIDNQLGLAVLKTSTAAAPGVPFAPDAAFARAQRTTLGQLLTGDEVGARLPSTISALVPGTGTKRYIINNWRASLACIAEIKSRDFLFLSRVTPADKVPDAAIVTKPGLGLLGAFTGRLSITGGPKPVLFYRTVMLKDLRALMAKCSVSSTDLSTPPAGPKAVDDADTAFQAACIAISSSAKATPADAATAATNALNLRPNSAVLKMLLGTALAAQGKFDDAIKNITAAIQASPSLAGAKLARGNAYAALGKTADAEKDFRQDIADRPSDIRPVLALVDLLGSSAKTTSEAVKLGQEAVAKWSDDLDAKITLARAYKRNKDYDSAISELQAVLKVAPKWGAATTALALTYEAAGERELAEAQYRKCVEDDPQNPLAHLNLIDYLISAGKTDAARTAITEIRKLTLTNEISDAVKKMESSLDSTATAK